MTRREFFKIRTNTLIRDELVERRLIESRRERIALWLMLGGAVMILYAILG